MPNYDELEQTLSDMLEKKKQKQQKEEQDRQTRNDQDRNKILENVGRDFGGIMSPYLDELKNHSRLTSEELKRIISESVNVEVPPIDASGLSEAVKSSISESFRGLKFPIPKVNVSVPDVKVPNIKVPAINFPKKLSVLLDAVDKFHPLPVQMVDPDGDPYYPGGGYLTGGSGPKPVSDILTPGGQSAMDEANKALRVNVIAGSVSLSGNDTNQGPSGANTLRVVIATDSENSTNLNQLNGLTIAAGSGEQNSNTLRVAFATDSVASVSFGGNLSEDHNIGPSGANTLRVTMATDSENSTNLNQINGNAIAVGSGEQNSNTLRVAFATDSVASVTFGGLLSEDHNSGPSGANTLRVTQATDSISSVNLNTLNGNAVAVGSGESNSNTLRVAFATDSVASVAFGGLLSEDHNIGPSGANTLRVTSATDSNSSVNLVSSYQDTNIGPSGANTLRTTIATDSVSSVNLVNQAEGSGEANANSLRVIQATDGISSVNLTQVAGNNIATGGGEATTNANTLRVAMATDIISSVNLVSSYQDTNIGPSGANTLRVTSATDSLSSVQLNAIAMTTNPSAASDAATTVVRADKLGRLLNTPVQVRQLRSTAFATLGGATGSNTETALIAGIASTFLDLIYVVFANTSGAAVSIDIRQGTGGAVIGNVNVPANASQGFSLMAPIPMTEAAQAWTIKFNSTDMGSDLSNTKVYATGLFSQEI